MEKKENNIITSYTTSLNLYDKVIFKYKIHICEYQVFNTFLILKSDKSDKSDKFDNSYIFIILNISNEFITNAYGYLPTGGGGWPEYKNNDFAAATRLVNAIYKLIEDKLSNKNKLSLGINLRR